MNGSRPSASMGKASAAASGFAQKQQSTDFPAARGDEFRKNAGLRTGRLLRKNQRRQIRALLDAYQSDANRDHMVMPGVVHLSHPTEYGTLYSRAELAEISALCRSRGIPLYLDSARLAYALACPQNDVTLADIAAL